MNPENKGIIPSLDSRLSRPAEIGLVPHDNDAMVHWYRQELKLTVHSDTKIPIGFNRRHIVGGAIVKLLCVDRSPKEKPPLPVEGPCLRRLVLAPDDDGKLYQTAMGLASKVSDRKGEGFESVLVRDPDGNELDIVHRLDGSKSAAVQIEVGSSDVALTKDFYCGKLSLPEIKPDAFAPPEVFASIGWREMSLNIVPATGKHPSPNGNTTDAAGIRYLTAIVKASQQTTDDMVACGVDFPVKPMIWREVALIAFAADPDGNLTEIAGPLKDPK